MELISVTGVEAAIAKYRAAEAELAAFFGLKPVKAKRAKASNGVKAKAKKNGRKKGITPMQQHVRVLQGRYMGVLRSLTATDKAKVKKLRAEKGVQAAIALAKKLAS